MLTVPISEEQFIKLVEQLPSKVKEMLMERLQREIYSQKTDALLKEIDKRKQSYPITDQELEEEIEQAREDIYKNSR